MQNESVPFSHNISNVLTEHVLGTIYHCISRKIQRTWSISLRDELSSLSPFGREGSVEQCSQRQENIEASPVLSFSQIDTTVF